ncbi:hypothetical protein [Sulfurisphaera ohwakuensis]|uniref:hypothetical protein n=1 Tax=Sulfurisphaera ohwakuensis TaxID=69656 RepID=UPI0036F1AB6E
MITLILQECVYLPLYIGFTNNNLYSILNGTIGGDPIAIDRNDPVSVTQYNNGPNVFPIYVNFYNYGYYDHWQEISNDIYQWYDFSNVLPVYNYRTLNGSIITGNPSLQVTSNGPMYGLEMLDGTNQGSYILINSTVLNYYFQNYLSSQGVGINTFVYFSGIPWEDSPPSDPYNPFGATPLVSDNIVISYVFNKPSINSLNFFDVSIGSNTPVPLNYPITVFEYSWSNGGSGAGYSSGYYVGIPEITNTYYCGFSKYVCSILSDGINGGCTFTCAQGKASTRVTFVKHSSYYYAGTAYAGSDYYFGNDYSGVQTSSQYIPFDPEDQQNNNNYAYYGILYTYYWYNIDSQNSNNIDTYFLVNGNIYNNPLPKQSYSWSGCLFSNCNANAILPESPSTYIAQSYQNAYETAFVAEENRSLYNYPPGIFSNGIPPNFIEGTFGYQEKYGNTPPINYLSANSQYYQGMPYLFISAGSGGGSGYMYLDWVIATFGVPYEINVP